MNAILNTDMTRAEAEVINKSLKTHILDMWAMLLEMRDRRGWKALGYASFEEWGEAELGFSKPHLYRLASAAEVQANLKSLQLETNGIPESQLRPLAQLPAQEQAEAFQIAKARAETENGGKVTAKIVETVVQERKSSAKPKPKPQQQVIEEVPPILANDIPHTTTQDCENSELWETQLGDILKLVEALPPIYQLYASRAVNKVVEASAIREWENHPASNIESIEFYRDAADMCSTTAERAVRTTFIGDNGIPSLFNALCQGKIADCPATLISCLPKEHQSAAMERLEIPIEEPQAEISIPTEPEPDMSSVEAQTDTESTGIDESGLGNDAPKNGLVNTHTCNACKEFRPRAKRCDAGHTDTITFSKHKSKAKFRPYDFRHCDSFKPAHPDTGTF